MATSVAALPSVLTRGPRLHRQTFKFLKNGAGEYALGVRTATVFTNFKVQVLAGDEGGVSTHPGIPLSMYAESGLIPLGAKKRTLLLVSSSWKVEGGKMEVRQTSIHKVSGQGRTWKIQYYRLTTFA